LEISVSLLTYVMPALGKELLGKNIKNVHIHDNCGEMDEHLAVSDGKINFRSIFSNLNMYRDNFVIEVHKEEDVLRSKEKIY